MDLFILRVLLVFVINLNFNKKLSLMYELIFFFLCLKDGNCVMVKIGFFEFLLFWVNVVFVFIIVFFMVG